MQSNPTIEWWRPDAPAVEGDRPAADEVADSSAQGRLAFGALVVFTIILVASPQEHFPILKPLRIALVAGLISLVAYIAQRFAGLRNDAGPRRELTIAIWLVVWAVVTIPASIWRGGSVDLLLNLFIKSVLVFWLLGVLIDTAPRLIVMVWTLSLLILPLAVSALRQYAGGDFVRTGRIDGYADGIAGNPNDLALLVAIILPFTLALALQSRHVVGRLVALLLLGAGAAAIVATFSRSGFLVLAAVVLMYVISLVRRGAVLVGVGALLLVLAAIPLLPSGFGDRISTITNIEADHTGSAQARWRDMQIAADYLTRAPIVGAGLGMNVLLLNELRGPEWTMVHNVYLEYGVDLGLPGLMLFLALFGAVLVAASRAARALAQQPRMSLPAEIARATWISLVAFAIAGLFYPVAYHFYFYYLAGLAVAVRRISVRRG